MPSGHHEVLRFLRSRVVNAVQFIGVDERRRSRADDRGLPLDGHSNVALHQQEEFLVLVPVGRMRLASWSKDRLVDLEVLPGVEHAVQNRPGFVLTILLYRQFAIRFDERSRVPRYPPPMPRRRRAWESPAKQNAGLYP